MQKSTASSQNMQYLEKPDGNGYEQIPFKIDVSSQNLDIQDLPSPLLYQNSNDIRNRTSSSFKAPTYNNSFFDRNNSFLTHSNFSPQQDQSSHYLKSANRQMMPYSAIKEEQKRYYQNLQLSQQSTPDYFQQRKRQAKSQIRAPKNGLPDLINNRSKTPKQIDNNKNIEQKQSNTQCNTFINTLESNQKHIVSDKKQQFMKTYHQSPVMFKQYKPSSVAYNMSFKNNKQSQNIFQIKRAQEAKFSSQSKRIEPIKTASNFYSQGNQIITKNSLEDNLSAQESMKQSGSARELKVKEVIYQKTGIKIGQGKFGPIEIIIYKNQIYALKKIPKTTIDSAKRIEHIKNEKSICLALNEISLKEKLNFFVKLNETFSDADSINFIFEYLPGQDLYQAMQNELNIMNRKAKHGQKDWVKFYAAEVLMGLSILHKNKIIYRDLKPENVAIDSNGHAKLIDFGFAKRLSSRNKYRTFTNCGTLGYTAPEILLNISQGYSFEVDIWSYGIFLCELIQGTLPFEDKEDAQMIEEQIVKCEIKIPRDADPYAKDLLQQILVMDPNLRISLENIKQHKYFAEIDWHKVEKGQLKPVPFVPINNKYENLLQNKYESTSNLETGKTVQQKRISILGDFTIYKVNREFKNF